MDKFSSLAIFFYISIQILIFLDIKIDARRKYVFDRDTY